MRELDRQARLAHASRATQLGAAGGTTAPVLAPPSSGRFRAGPGYIFRADPDAPAGSGLGFLSAPYNYYNLFWTGTPAG
eukprot:12656850-Heterocapsa_arctica.AAC.1